MISGDGILMVEPSANVSTGPLIDELTRRMTAAWRKRRDSDYRYRGFHRCRCGATSDNRDHYVGDANTNSLCIHYLAFHRDELPKEELDKVRALDFGEGEPTEEELRFPKSETKR
jgi:hypothetical protein